MSSRPPPVNSKATKLLIALGASTRTPPRRRPYPEAQYQKCGWDPQVLLDHILERIKRLERSYQLFRRWDDTPAHGAGIIDLTLIVVLHESVQDIGERLSVAGEEGRSAQHGAADRTAVGVAAGGLVHGNL